MRGLARVQRTGGIVPAPPGQEHLIRRMAELCADGSGSESGKKILNPSEAPGADFAVTDPILAAYESCNPHGLRKAEA